MTVEEAHSKFVERIGLYNGFLFQTSSHFSSILRSEQDFSETISVSDDFIRPILSSRLLYRNPISGKHVFSYLHSVDVANLKDSLNNLKVHYFNFVIAQCFEAFETYLKDIIVAYVLSNRLQHSALGNSTDFETCRESLSKFCRKGNINNVKLFAILYELKKKISEMESDNWLQFEFKEWNIVFTEIRHSIVHSNGKFNLNKAKNWTSFQNELLTRLFVAKTEKNIGFISAVEEYRYTIHIIAQHGQIIFELLQSENNDID